MPDGGVRALRVAVDVTPAVRQHAGVGRYARELVRALASRGIVDVVPLVADRMDRSAAADALGPGVPRPVVTGIPSRWQAIAWHRLGLPPAADRYVPGARVFHATDFLLPPLRHARSVVTVHDLSFLSAPECHDPRLRRHLARAVPRSVARADRVLADSGATRDDLVGRGLVDRGRVTVAYPGVGPGFRPDVDGAIVDALRRRLGLERSYVLGVGTIEPRKNWPVLIDAFERSRLDDHSLVIAGSAGWLQDGTLEAARRASADVRLVGFVADEDLPGLYAGAAAFAYPSRYEGFGLPPLEAMACGVPTVVSDAPPMPEVTGGAAVVVPTGDPEALAEALRRVVRDGATRARLAAVGPARAALFTWDACAEVAEAAYRHAAEVVR